MMPDFRAMRLHACAMGLATRAASHSFLPVLARPPDAKVPEMALRIEHHVSPRAMGLAAQWPHEVCATFSAMCPAHHKLRARPDVADGTTLMSTYPIGKAAARKLSSVTVVGSLHDFSGHQTHTGTSGLSFDRSDLRCLTRTSCFVTNR